MKMLKSKLLPLLCLLLLTIVTLTSLTACGAHTHTFGEWEETTAATCATEGVQTRTCSCGEKETRPIAKLAHTLQSIPGREATCTKEGATEGQRCTVCNTVVTPSTTIPKKAHTPVTVPGTPATKDTEGVTDGTRCSVCDQTLTAGSVIPKLTANALRMDAAVFGKGQEFDKTKPKVYAIYPDGDELPLAPELFEAEVSTYNKNKKGTYALTVTLTGTLSLSTSVKVGDPVVTGIEVTGLKTTYYTGQSFSQRGGRIYGLCSDGTRKSLHSFSFDTTGYNNQQPGNYTVYVSATADGNTFTAEIAVTVLQTELVSIAVTPSKTTYFPGETVEKKDLTVTGTYNSGNVKELGAEDFSVSSDLATAAGTYTVTVTADDVTPATYQVRLFADRIASLTLSGQKTSFSYKEDFSTRGITVTANCASGTTMVLSANDYVVDSSSYISTWNGTYPITVALQGRSDVSVSYDVTLTSTHFRVLFLSHAILNDTLRGMNEMLSSLYDDVLISGFVVSGVTNGDNLTGMYSSLQNQTKGTLRTYTSNTGITSNAQDTTGVTLTEVLSNASQQYDMVCFAQSGNLAVSAARVVTVSDMIPLIREASVNKQIQFSYLMPWMPDIETYDLEEVDYFANYDNSTVTMFRAIAKVAEDLSAQLPELRILPVATAFAYARGTDLYHKLLASASLTLTKEQGIYLTRIALICMLTGRAPNTIVGNYTSGLLEADAALCRQLVATAMADPYGKNYTEPGSEPDTPQ